MFFAFEVALGMAAYVGILLFALLLILDGCVEIIKNSRI